MRPGWVALGVIEVLGGILLIVPTALNWLPALTPLAAAVLTVETLALAAVYASYSRKLAASNPLVFALPMGLVAAFVAYGRYVLVQAYIAAMPGWKRDVGRHLDTLITELVPHVRKAVRWNSPFYGVEGQGWFLNYHCFTKYVKVTFLRGTSLDPLPPGESKHEHVRYLDIREDEPLDEAQLAAWIREAAELPGDPLF